jgi:hypothetical protein
MLPKILDPGNPQSLSDAAIRRIQARDHSIPGSQRKAESSDLVQQLETAPPEEEKADDKVALKATTIREASIEAQQMSFQPIGSSMYRKGHTLWSMEPDSSGRYALVRHASEPSDFPVEDDPSEVVHEAPYPSGEEKEASRAVQPVRPSYEETLVATAGKEFPDVTDRYGIAVRMNDIVSYPLGGEYVKGRVAAVTTAGNLDIRLEHQVDRGVPADFVVIDRKSRQAQMISDSAPTPPSSPEHDADKQEKDNLNLSMHKSLEAENKRLAFVQHWATYGAVLADQILLAPNLSEKTKTAMLSTFSATRGVAEVAKSLGHSKAASWDSLKEYAGEKATETVRNFVYAGLQSRMMSRDLNLPLAMTMELRGDIGKMPRKHASTLRLGLTEMKTASIQDKTALELMKLYGADTVKKWSEVLAKYKKGELRLQKKTAIDTTAKNYWTAYFGEYGDEWVRDVKRRLRADLVAAKLKMQALDDTATDYWSNYYGEYGDELTKEVNRAVTKNPKVQPERTAAVAIAPQMQLPPDGRGNQPARRDIFAGVKLILDESLPKTAHRVGLAKTTNGYNVLVRTSNAQKVQFAKTEKEAHTLFAGYVKSHITG